MSDGPLPPLGQRSIVSVGVTADPEGKDAPAFQFVCDCAWVTTVRFEGADERIRRDGGFEASYLCEGCRTVHWLTIGSDAIRKSFEAERHDG